jgi:AcrR family transcriptional regulator
VARDVILAAAEDVFDDQGLDAGMEAIAAQAGVAVGTLYNHFADRRALVEALLDARRTQLLARLETITVSGFEARLVAILTVLCDVDARHAKFRRALIESGLLHDEQRRRENRQKFQPVFDALFSLGAKEGLVRAATATLQRAQLLGLFRATFELALEHPEAMKFAQVPQAVTRAFLHGAVKRGRT